MNHYLKYKFYLIIIILLILIIFIILILKNDYLIEEYSYFKFESNEISIIINLKNLTNNKHKLFYDVMRKINSSRNFYFIKSNNNCLDQNAYSFVGNSSVKIIKSNFPDSIFLPLAISLYGKSNPSFILFIEGEEFSENCGNNLIDWIYKAYESLIKNDYDYIFGNSQIVDGNKIGCSILLSNSSIIEHLLYFTNSDTSHMHPFAQLSLAKKTKFCFIQFNYTIYKNPIHINGILSFNAYCPSINDKENPSLCIILPNFKRNYLSYSFPKFSYQTYKPKFYLVIQNEDRIHYNISLIQKMVKEPVYHIWMQNFNSFFFLNHRLSSLVPCDFILKYDDDQWPMDNLLQEKLINLAKNKNVIIGKNGYLVPKYFCGYTPNKYLNLKDNVVDHSAVPLLIRPGFLKLDARNYIYRLYGGEDIALSLNSYKLCNVTSIKIDMNLTEMQNDGNNQGNETQIVSEYKKEKRTNFNLFIHYYCFLIRSGYIPRKWTKFKLPKKAYLNILILHKSLN